MRRAGRCAAATLASVCERVQPGVRGVDIDRWVREDTAARGARPSQLGFHGFPAAVCVSPNAVVCHGIPSARPLAEGDIVNIDVTSELKSMHGDTSRTLCVGTVSPAKGALVETTRAAMMAGIEAIAPGVRLGDVAAAIQAVAHAGGYGVVREFGGHGIGRKMHMPPHVDHGAPAGTGLRLRAGMCLTIEPMLTVGSPELRTLDDGWTVVTADHSPSAQFEHTVLVTKGGYEILTLPPGA